MRALWRLYHMAYWPQRLLLNRADVVATISGTTRSLIARHRLTTRTVRIVGNAPQPGALVRNPDDAPDKSLLYMGSFMPYKNVETVVRGMAHLPGYTLHLLSRISPERRSELQALVPPGTEVVFHNGVTEEVYTELLRSTTALVTLSRDEGYGLPMIEAMAAGTPVIASDFPIFAEVSGGAALLVDPDSPEEFAAAVRALSDPARWRRASDAGIRRADAFAAVSSGDNSNILAARVVREIYHVDNVVARIYDQGRAAVYERLGIPTVATVKWTVSQVLRRLQPEGSVPVWRDPTGTARLMQIHVHNGWVGRRISELQDAADSPIPFVQRVGRGIVPDRDTVFQDGDLIYVACHTDRTDELETLFANPPARG